MVRPPAVDATARGELVHEWADIIISEGGAADRNKNWSRGGRNWISSNTY